MQENEIYLQMRKDFKSVFVNKIIPTVQKYEDERKSKLKKAIFWFSFLIILGILIVCTGVYVLFHYNNTDNATKKLFYYLSITCFIIAGIVWASIQKGFEGKIKSKIMPAVCRCFECGLKWSNNSYKDGKEFCSAGIIPKYNDEYYDDDFSGSHKNVRIRIIESKYERGSGKHRQTVFDGVIIKLDMNKNFTSHTIIKSNTVLNISPIKNLKHTQFEDPEFNKKYDVYTDDEVDARYLITPSFIERLKNIKMAFSAKKIICAFYKTSLYIALHTNKDLFSICSLFKRIDEPNQYYKMFEEILSIIKLIDHFKLDQKIKLEIVLK